MTGLPAGFGVELYLGGSWVDVTGWHVGEDRTRLRAGRASEHEDAKPQQLDLQLRNDDGRFTPRSVASPYYPHVTRGVPIRLTVTPPGGTSTAVWAGTVVSWDPEWPGPGLRGGTVRVTARDVLGELEGITLDDRWTEEARAAARAASSWCDVVELDAATDATALDVVGVAPSGGASGSCVIGRPGGSLSWGDPDGVTLARSMTCAPSSGVGPVLTVTPAGAPGGVDVWLQVPDTATAATQDVLTLMAGTSVLARLRLWPYSAGVLTLGVQTTGPTGVVTGVQDGVWRHVQLRPAAGAPGSLEVRVSDGTTPATTVTVPGVALASVTSMLVGAAAGGTSPATCTLAGLVVSGHSTPLSTSWGLPGQTMHASDAYAALQRFCPTVTSWATRGTEDRIVGEPSWSGATAAAVLHQLARTVVGVAWARPDGAAELVMGDVARPASPAVTLDVAQDLDGRIVPTFRDASAEQPTRVAIRWAGGTLTVVDAAAETSRGERVQVDLDTCAADETGARAAGAWALQASDALRVTSLGVDAYSTMVDRWAALLGLFPTQLIRTTGWPVPMAGAAVVDVHVEGWQLELSESGWVYQFDCSPAGLFPAGVWDGVAGVVDDYGRWALQGGTVTGGTAVGSTAPGTLVVAFAGGVGLSTAAGDYPMLLDWFGEVVRVDTPPAGSVSPQTVTAAARGLQSTAARVHAAGEALDLWHAAVWGY